MSTLTITGDLRGEWEGADGGGVDGSADDVPIFSSLCSPLSCLFSSCTSWNSLFSSDKVALKGKWEGASGGGVDGSVKNGPIIMVLSTDLCILLLY